MINFLVLFVQGTQSTIYPFQCRHEPRLLQGDLSAKDKYGQMIKKVRVLNRKKMLNFNKFVFL